MKIPGSRSYTWLIYAIIWGMVWGYPAFTAIFVAVKAGSAVLWDGVLHAWAGILPFFLLFLLHRLRCAACSCATMYGSIFSPWRDCSAFSASTATI